MKPLLPLLVALLTTAMTSPSPAAEPRPDFHVAPGGKDEWSGRLARPNQGRTDGPFATVAHAQAAVRGLRKAEPARQQPVVVQIAAGTYALDRPLLFTPEDSGTAASPTLYTAAPGAKPILSGGQTLTGWRRGEGGRWELSLPEVKAGRWNFTQLWVGGERRYRPRLPKQGYFTIADALPSSPEVGDKGFDGFKFRSGDLRANWHRLGDVEVLGFQIWTMARFRIRAITEADQSVRFTGHTTGKAHYSALPKEGRYLVENVREALTEPGEWYLDRENGVLTYLPRPGEDPSRTVVIAPRTDTLLELRGDPTGRKWVEHIQFRGLTFSHSNWVTPPQGRAYPQAEADLGAAITAVGARDCAISSGAIRHVGEYAVQWGVGCKRNRLEDCEITDLGAGGVKIGTTDRQQDAELETSHTTIHNCLIAHGGRMHPAAIGVWIGHSPHNTLSHNEIADFYYTAISVGWSWGYEPSGAHHNTLEYNHLHHIGQGVLSDMGGTYTLGLSPGSVQRGNHIHDVQSFGYGGWGIYFDEGTTGMVAENNLVYRTKSAGFHQHYGRENIVRNNIFAFGREAQVMRTRPEEHLSFTFERNLVLWNDAPLLGSNWSGDRTRYRLDNNLYWRTDGKPVDFAGMTLEQWQAKGQDTHSLIADPLFENSATGDFRLKPGSPASKVGFTPFDASQAGRLPVNGKRPAPVKPEPAFPIP
jgi:hypothetical protein